MGKRLAQVVSNADAGLSCPEVSRYGEAGFEADPGLIRGTRRRPGERLSHVAGSPGEAGGGEGGCKAGADEGVISSGDARLRYLNVNGGGETGFKSDAGKVQRLSGGRTERTGSAQKI